MGSTQIIILVILVVVLLGGLGYVFWQNFINKEPAKEEAKKQETTKTEATNPYADWETYTSTRDGYSIKYPSDWIVRAETKTDGPYIRNFDPTSKPDTPRYEGTYYPQGYINVRVLAEKNDNNFKAIHGTTPMEWYGMLGTAQADNGVNKIAPGDVKNTTVNSLPAKSAKSTFTETDEVIYLLHNDALYTLSLFPYGASANDTVKKMLDSFTFL